MKFIKNLFNKDNKETITEEPVMYVTMKDKRAARKAAYEMNTSGDVFTIGHVDLLEQKCATSKDGTLTYGPVTICVLEGVGVQLSVNGKTWVKSAWHGLKEAYYLLKDSILALWHILGEFFSKMWAKAKAKVSKDKPAAKEDAVEAAASKVEVVVEEPKAPVVVVDAVVVDVAEVPEEVAPAPATVIVDGVRMSRRQALVMIEKALTSSVKDKDYMAVFGQVPNVDHDGLCALSNNAHELFEAYDAIEQGQLTRAQYKAKRSVSRAEWKDAEAQLNDAIAQL